MSHDPRHLAAIVGSPICSSQSDGKFGDQTASALATYAAPAKLARRMLGQRFAAIADIVKNDSTQVKFFGGWINRAVSLLEYV